MSDSWQQTPKTLDLSSDHIDIWLCHLKDLSKNIDEFYSLLAKDERERADKLKIEDKRKQYIITRGSLRQRLGSLTNLEPKDFVFEYMEHGKPVLANDPRYADITFNISHSNDFSLIAITLKQVIGIDIEKINPDSDHQQLVTRFFSMVEQSEFQALPEKIKAKAFCACWTRKEAFIKAVGDGVSYGLDNFDVSIDPENQSSKINLHQDSDETWSVHHLPINDDYIGCLVSNSDDVNVRCWQ